MKKLFTILFALLSFQINAQCWLTPSAGGGNSAGIKSDGTLWTWGSNSSTGALGDGTYLDKNIPTNIGSGTNWLSIAQGFGHAVSIKTDGTLWAWGSNSDGQLGDGTTISKSVPTQVGTAINWQSVSAGWYNCYSIKTDGTLWAWGRNSRGQLGDGTTISKSVPTQIGVSTNWKSISAGGEHSIGIKTDGTLWTWGYNLLGQLGNGGFGTTLTVNAPTQIGTANNWQSVSAGSQRSMGIKTDGTLWTWGVTVTVPTQIGTGTNWKSISAGSTSGHCLAIKTDGTLWAWGFNTKGQLGNGVSSTITVNDPIQIGTDNNWQSATVGGNHSIGIKTDGTLWVWGDNLSGQLGDGTNIDKSIPTLISCPFVGIEENSFNSNFISFYPNPASTVLNFKITDSDSIDGYVIMDVLGRKVLEQKENTTQINIEGLNKGIYQLLITSEGKSYASKFIKE